MKFLKKNHCMVDLSTTSTLPTSGIMSIGAVMFRYDSGLSEEFYVNVDAHDCKKRGLHVLKSTMSWWGAQPKEVMKALSSPKPILLEDALTQFFNFYNENNGQHIVSFGASFDIPIITNAANAVGIFEPWNQNAIMCDRTIMTMLDVDHSILKGGGITSLDTAKHQAQILIDAFSESKE
jgi:hypothetical protein